MKNGVFIGSFLGVRDRRRVLRNSADTDRQDQADPGAHTCRLCRGGSAFGAVGLYAPLAEFAGAGATTPLTGFGFLISKGIKKAVDERGLLGVLTGALTAASGGTAAALIFGFIAACITGSKPKS